MIIFIASHKHGQIDAAYKVSIERDNIGNKGVSAGGFRQSYYGNRRAAIRFHQPACLIVSVLSLHVIAKV